MVEQVQLSRRQLLLGAAVTGVSAFVAACTSAGSSPSALPATAVPATPTVAPVPTGTPVPSIAATATAPPSAAAITGDVLFWDNFTDDNEFAGLTRVQELFAMKYPGINLKKEDIPNEDYIAKLTGAIQAKTLPESGVSDVTRMGDLVGIGALTDATARIKSMSNYDSFAKSTWDGCTVAGKMYGVPNYMFVDWMYYRKDYFETAGITEFPKTWPDFLTVTQKLTDATAGRYGYGLRGGDGGADDIAIVIESFGTDFVDASGKPALDKNILIEAITFLSDLFTKYKVTPPSTPNDGYKGITEAFKTGQTAIFKHHTGSLTSILEAVPEDKLGTAVCPGKTRIAAWVAPNYVSAMKPDMSDATWAWMDFWADPDIQIEFLEKSGYFVSNLDSAQDPRLASRPVYKAAFDTVLQGRPGPSWAGYPGWSVDVLLTQFQALLIGQTTAAKAADVILAGLDKATA
jgi:multiple sugar transport system substrate-binding protein